MEELGKKKKEKCFINAQQKFLAPNFLDSKTCISKFPMQVA